MAKKNEDAVAPVEETAMTTVDDLENLPTVHEDSDFDDLTQAGDYLPRLQLASANSDLVTDEVVPANDFALVYDKSTADSLGKEVDCIMLDYRAKALDTGSDEPVSVFDRSHPEFERIKKQSDIKDSGCMFGPEFLVYIPSVEKFATFFCCSKSLRREARRFRDSMKRPITLFGRKVETPKYKWWIATLKECSTPFALPPKAEIMKQLEQFQNPPAPEIGERVEDDADTGREV